MKHLQQKQVYLNKMSAQLKTKYSAVFVKVNQQLEQKRNIICYNDNTKTNQNKQLMQDLNEKYADTWDTRNRDQLQPYQSLEASSLKGLQETKVLVKVGSVT